MSCPSRAEVQAAAQRLVDELGNVEPQGKRYGFVQMKEDILLVAQAALRRVPPAPRDPREDYVQVRGEPRPIGEFLGTVQEGDLVGVRITPASERFANRDGYGDDEFPTAGV